MHTPAHSSELKSPVDPIKPFFPAGTFARISPANRLIARPALANMVSQRFSAV